MQGNHIDGAGSVAQVAAIKEIKALGREGFSYRTYAEKQRELLALGYLGVTLEAIPPVVVETIFVRGA